MPRPKLWKTLVLTLFVLLAWLPARPSLADAPSTQPLLEGKDAFGDWSTDAPGVRRHFTVADVPAPFATQSARNQPKLVPRPAGAELHVPEGFVVDQLVDKLHNPRKIVTAPNSDLFLAESGANRIRVLRQGPDGTIASTEIFSDQLQQPFGIAFYPPGPDPQYVYVGNTGSIVRFPYKNGDLKATGKPEHIADVPSGGHLTGGGHWTRDVVFSLDGKTMFVSVGSHSNVNDDDAEKDRADVLAFNPDGSDKRIFASGIRNAVGLAIDPTSGVLWGSVNERDELGDNLPFDYITRITQGQFYGWPWYYLGNHQDPRHKGQHPELADKINIPDVLLQAHSASLCMTFYEAAQFPAAYHGMAFAAEHGSWNREKRTGYKVIAVPVSDAGEPSGEYDDFLTGFVTPDGDVWGRPVGVTVDKQGSLLVTDDGGNCIWRVKYGK